MSVVTKLDSRTRRVVGLCLLAVCCLVILALLRHRDAPRLADMLVQQHIPMAPLTAWLFISLTSAVAAATWFGHRKAARVIAMGLIAFVGVISIAILTRHVLGLDLPLEEWIVSISHSKEDAYRNLVSPLTAAAFAFCAVSLAVAVGCPGGRRYLCESAPVFGLASFLIGLVVLMSYAGGIIMLYSDQIKPMALSTAAAIVGLSAAVLVLVTPGTWLADILPSVSRESDSGKVANKGFILLIAIAIGIAVAGGSYLRLQLQLAHRSISSELSAIADLKAGEIGMWYQERVTDVRIVYRVPFMQSHVKGILAGQTNAEDRDELLRWMRNIRLLSPYRNVRLYDARGRLVLSALSVPEAEDITRYPEFSRIIHADDVLVTDLHKIGVGAHADIAMTLWAPVKADVSSGSTTLGFWMFDVDPSVYLFPLIRTWPSSSRSAETLLIRREDGHLVYLNEIRHQKNTALNLRFRIEDNPNLPAAMAVTGKTGIVEGMDYRGVPVVAALLQVPGTAWFMVSKVDREEMYAPLRERAELTGLIFLALLVAAVLGTGFLDRRQENLWLQSQLAVERELQAHRNLLETVVHNLPTGAAIVRCSDMVVQLVNPAYQAILPGREIEGKTVDAIWPEIQAHITELCSDVIRTGEPHTAVDDLIRIQRDPDSAPDEAYFTWSLFRVKLPGDESYGVLHTVWETTDRKRTEEALRQANEQLQKTSDELSESNEELAVSNEELRTTNDELCREIEHRQKAEADLRETRNYLESLLDYANAPIIVWDKDFNITRFNHAFESLTGYAADKVLGQHLRMLFPQESQEMALGEIEAALQGENLESSEIPIRGKDGGVRIVLWNSANITGPDGSAPVATIAQGQDITERKKAEAEAERARADAERHAAELGSFISSIADGVMLLNSSGEITYVNDACLRLFGSHPGESFGEHLAHFRRYDRDDRLMSIDQYPTRHGLQGRTVRDVYERFVSDDGSEVIASVSASPVYGPRRSIIGATAVFRDIRERIDFEKRREEVYKREHHIADVLQQALIPTQTDYAIPCCRIAVRYQPALKEAEIGGDFYDVFQLDEHRYGIIIGDVAGKGLTAAMRVAAARYAIRSYAFLEPEPARVLEQANDALCRDNIQTGGMLTAFFGIIDTASRLITYASGGHEPPVVRSRNGDTHELDATGIPLSVMEGAPYTQGSYQLNPGDAVVMMTDGITEARTADRELFGKERVEEYIASNNEGNPDSMASGLLEAAVSHAGGKLQDDAAVVALLVLPE